MLHHHQLDIVHLDFLEGEILEVCFLYHLLLVHLGLHRHHLNHLDLLLYYLAYQLEKLHRHQLLKLLLKKLKGCLDYLVSKNHYHYH
jgi:hypothetical protein|tara:strand:+ start:342 stop:602 length:261 start_codon:yes stop_codon:yes gene_type:complete